VLDFGGVVTGSKKALTLTATNSENTSITVTSAVSSTAEFAWSGAGLPVTIAAGQSIPLSITFTPDAAANASGTFSISSNATNQTASVTLSGTGLAPPQVQVSPTSIGFGTVTVGSTQSEPLTLTNTGGSDVTISQATVSGAGFQLAGLSVPLTLTSGQSSSFSVTFTPQSAATVSGNLAITSNATNSTLNSALSGTGVTSSSGTAISLSFQTAPPTTLQVNATTSITAVVANDSTNAGVDWSVTCGSAGACGSFNPTHTASGSPTTYTAPSAVPSGNTVTVTGTSTADPTKFLSASISIGQTIAVIAVQVQLPMDTAAQSILPYVDGVTLYVNWANGGLATDTTTCTTAPCTQTTDFATVDSFIAAYSSATCGATLRGKGSPCIVNLGFAAVSGLNSYNVETPAWVFSQAWADTVGSPVQDAVFCSDVPQNTTLNPLPPAAATANITTTNCGSAGNTPCTEATVATGVPAIWETPYVTAVNAWHQAIIQHYASVTYANYLRLGVSTADEAAVTCATINGVAGTGLESLTSPATDDGLKAAWTGAAVDQIAYNATQRAALSSAPSWQLMNTTNMGMGLSVQGGYDPSWAIVEADAVLANQPYAIGTQGLKNGQMGSDVNNVDNTVCTGLDCCSDNWCNVHLMVEGKVPAIEMQECNLSNPGGGTSGCLDCILAGTCTNDSDTLSQVLVLSAQHGTTSQEIYQGEFQCAFDQADYVSTNPACTPAVGAAYAAAIQVLAAGP
jgi:hypothetical protein